MGVPVSEITKIIEGLAPRELAEAWDNVGLLIGRENRIINKILICLDVTESVIREAVSLGAEMIISHHPVIFGGINNIREDIPPGGKLFTLIKENICVYCAHTNLDFADGGLNDFCADLLELSDLHKDSVISKLRIGILKSEMNLNEFMLYTMSKLSVSNIRIIGSDNLNNIKNVKHVAISTGAYYRELLPALIKERPDVLITGEIKHHDALELEEYGLCAIDAGHYGTEQPALRLLETCLQRLQVSVYISKTGKTPYLNIHELDAHNRNNNHNTN